MSSIDNQLFSRIAMALEDLASSQGRRVRNDATYNGILGLAVIGVFASVGLTYKMYRHVTNPNPQSSSG